jgi:hypothetical protein
VKGQPGYRRNRLQRPIFWVEPVFLMGTGFFIVSEERRSAEINRIAQIYRTIRRDLLQDIHHGRLGLFSVFPGGDGKYCEK